MTATPWPDRPLPALDLWTGSALGWATVVALALIPLSLALLVLDPRVLDGEALWLKPLKFQVSMAVLTGTLLLAVATSGLGTSLWVRIPSVAVAATALYELTFLNIQAARGVRSHFNADTLFDRIGGTIMAGGAGVLVLGAALIGIAILALLAMKGRAALDEPVLLALGLGLALGGWLGGYTGSAIGANGGPFVGAAAGPFVPLMGWSLTGGDLRIAHFLGLHAMQALPLLALGARVALPVPGASLVVIASAGVWTALTLAAMQAAQAGSALSFDTPSG
jgi:hypothetical protein